METTSLKVRRMFVHILAAYGGSFLWMTFFITVLRLISAPLTVGGALPPVSAMLAIAGKVFPDLAARLSADPMMTMFLGLFFAPVTEEVIFRMLPLTAAMALKRRLPAPYRKQLGRPLVLAFLLFFSVFIFGIGHGGPINVFIQGAVGLALGWLYLKNDESTLASYLSCVMVHCAYNFTIMVT